jgi:hypothetical protein
MSGTSNVFRPASGAGATTLVAIGDKGRESARLIGGDAGAAGVAEVDCGNGVALMIDALDLTTIIEIEVSDRTDLLAISTVQELAGTDAAIAVMDLEAEPVAVTIPADRTAAFRAAARNASSNWTREVFSPVEDPELALIGEVVQRAALADAGIPIDGEIGRLDVPDLLDALRRFVGAAPLSGAELPSEIATGLAVAHQYLPADDPDLRFVEQLVSGRTTPTPEPLGAPATTGTLRRLLGRLTPVARPGPAFAPGDERTDSLEWHLDVVPPGFALVEDGISTRAEGSYVRITTPLEPEADVKDGKAWAVVFDAKTGALVTFAPGRAGTDPLGLVPDHELTNRWTSVLTLPPGTSLPEVYVAIRDDPRQPGADTFERELGRPRRFAMTARELRNRADAGEPLDAESANRSLERAVEGFTRIADRYRTIDPDRANEAAALADQCQHELDAWRS